MTTTLSGRSSYSYTRLTDDAPIVVIRWATERPLFALTVLCSLALWVVLAISVIGIVYAAFLAAFFFVLQVAFIAHLRGSAVRLGPEQFPALHQRVESLAWRMGITRMPEVYLMQAGGSLNALATRFLRTHMVVLFSDLLDACGDDESARDMIIAHELGHIHAGHLRWAWVILPGCFIPFLGSALSRAREYTCDRYGIAGAGNSQGALLGLSILAAGARHGRAVNHRALVRQRRDLNTGWMTIGEWFASHPPLAKRVLQVDPSLDDGGGKLVAGRLRAIGILAALAAPLVIATVIGASRIPALLESVANQQAAVDLDEGDDFTPPPAEEGIARARADIAVLVELIDGEERSGKPVPWDSGELYALWSTHHPEREAPLDPFDGTRYGYDLRGTAYRIWSTGPDGRARTADDIRYDSRTRDIR